MNFDVIEFYYFGILVLVLSKDENGFNYINI